MSRFGDRNDCARPDPRASRLGRHRAGNGSIACLGGIHWTIDSPARWNWRLSGALIRNDPHISAGTSIAADPRHLSRTSISAGAASGHQVGTGCKSPRSTSPGRAARCELRCSTARTRLAPSRTPTRARMKSTRRASAGLDVLSFRPAGHLPGNGRDPAGLRATAGEAVGGVTAPAQTSSGLFGSAGAYS